MQRRKALAWSAAGSLLLLTSALAVGTGLLDGGRDEPADAVAAPTTTTTTAPTTTAPAPVVVTQVRDVYDTVVVPTAPPPAAPAPAPAPAATPVAAPPPAPTPPAAPARTPATTTAPPPTYLGEDVEIPEDWPADRPLPPIPEGCVKPHLEDNGVWNCEH